MDIEVPLGVPPVVAGLGVGVHGRAGRLRDRFLLPELWAFHLYRYYGRLNLDGVEFELRPGTVSLVPPGVVTGYRYAGVSEHLFAHLRLPDGPTRRRMPAVLDVGRTAVELNDLMSRAITVFPTAPAGAAAYLWAALWRVSGLTVSETDPVRSRIDPVLAYVEARLAHPLPVAELAAVAGLSATHLTRLFRQVTGESTVGYVRRRRMAHAEHLLRATTLPVVTVARSVGISDLQAFNKACRHDLGASPRALRVAGPAPVPSLIGQRPPGLSPGSGQ